MHTITRVALACTTTILLVSCAKKEQASTDSAVGAADSTAAMAPAPAPALALADVAGKWNFRNVPEAGNDTTPTEFVLDAKPDSAAWTMTFKSGLKVTPTVRTAGDTLILKAGPFASQRRKGVKVTTETPLRLENGKLVGRTTAHYDTKGADSVIMLRAEGTKAP